MTGLLPIRDFSDATALAVTKTTSYTMTTADSLILASPGAAVTMVVTLATAASMSGRFVIIRTSGLGAAATMTIAGSGAETINGSNTASMSLLNRSAILYSDGTGWHIIAGNLL